MREEGLDSGDRGLVQECRVECSVYVRVRCTRHDTELGTLCKKKRTLGRCAKIERTAVFVKVSALPKDIRKSQCREHLENT